MSKRGSGRRWSFEARARVGTQRVAWGDHELSELADVEEYK